MYHSAVIMEPLAIVNPLLRKREGSNIDPNLRKLALEESRRLITFGCSLTGQLGHSNFVNANIPAPVTSLENHREWNEEYGESTSFFVCLLFLIVCCVTCVIASREYENKDEGCEMWCESYDGYVGRLWRE